MNEETIIEKRPNSNGQHENKNEGGAWKYATLGGISGILMGAGLMYAGQATAAATPETAVGEEGENAVAADGQQAADAVGASLPVAKMHNDLSFGEAFAAARAEVGSGGVFIWHGGIYNTYTAEEWNAMTTEQKNDFAHQVNPEVRAHAVPTPTDDHPDIAVHTTDTGAVHAAGDAADVQVIEHQIAENFDMGDDVHIVGYGDVEGHLVVSYDVTGDGQADVAIIDVDGNLRPSDDDIIVDREGNMATLGELNDAPDMADNAQADLDYPMIEV